MNKFITSELESRPGRAAVLTNNAIEQAPTAGAIAAFTKPVANPSPILDIATIKARQKVTWETGDFGQVAKYTMPSAEEFMASLELRPGMRVLDAACGTGNLAVIAARRGCKVSGLDQATNLISQAVARAKEEGFSIDYTQGDAEAMPYDDNTFDAVVSMYGVMFAPRPDLVVKELCRVTKPGGLIALANWQPNGFVGKMFEVFGRYVPPAVGVPSPLLWGDEKVVSARFQGAVRELRLRPRIARMRFPFNPAATVDFFRRYYGPTQRAFNSLGSSEQHKFYQELVDLQTRHNVALEPEQTDTPSAYLEIQARK